MAKKKTPSARKRRQTYEAGLYAEFGAKIMLRMKGYSLLEQRYKTPVGEIDLIAKRGAHISFVEVKYRRTWEEAAFSISDHQKKRINKAALIWLSKQNNLRYDSLSFDVILCARWTVPTHIKNAFEEV